MEAPTQSKLLKSLSWGYLPRSQNGSSGSFGSYLDDVAEDLRRAWQVVARPVIGCPPWPRSVPVRAFIGPCQLLLVLASS